MAGDDPFFYSPLDEDAIGGESTGDILKGILSPASAQSIVAPPPSSAPKTAAGQTTPQTGSLATAPTQSQPKVSGPAMIPGVATKPENLASKLRTLQANYAAQSQSGPAPTMPASAGAVEGMPSLPTTASNIAPAGQQKLAQDQAKLANYQQTGSGIDQIKNRWLRGLARGGDIAESVLAPNVERITPGTMGNNERLQDIQQGRIANDQQQLQQGAQLADTQSQTLFRQQEAAKNQSLAAADQPITLTAEQAKGIGHPELEGLPVAPKTYAAMQVAKTRADAQVQTGAGHDTAKVTTGEAHDAASRANTTANINSRESIAAARDKTQQLIAQMRDNTSTANNQRTNDRIANGKTGTGDSGGNFKVPSVVTNRAELASNAQENGAAALEIIQRRPDLLGSLSGRFTNVAQMMGSDDPDIAALGNRIHNMALASNGAHGLRSKQAVEGTEKALLNDFHNGATATTASIKATMNSVQTFLDDEKNFQASGRRTGAPAPNRPQVDPSRLAPNKNAPLGSIAFTRPDRPNMIYYIPREKAPRFAAQTHATQISQQPSGGSPSAR